MPAVFLSQHLMCLSAQTNKCDKSVSGRTREFPICEMYPLTHEHLFFFPPPLIFTITHKLRDIGLSPGTKHNQKQDNRVLIPTLGHMCLCTLLDDAIIKQVAKSLSVKKKNIHRDGNFCKSKEQKRVSGKLKKVSDR